jgi:hypothetical protein
VTATEGRFDGINAIPAWKVTAEGRSEFRVSAIDPWQFRIELTQQSGSEEEFCGDVFPLAGQQACVW